MSLTSLGVMRSARYGFAHVATRPVDFRRRWQVKVLMSTVFVSVGNFVSFESIGLLTITHITQLSLTLDILSL